MYKIFWFYFDNYILYKYICTLCIHSFKQCGSNENNMYVNLIIIFIQMYICVHVKILVNVQVISKHTIFISLVIHISSSFYINFSITSSWEVIYYKMKYTKIHVYENYTTSNTWC